MRTNTAARVFKLLDEIREIIAADQKEAILEHVETEESRPAPTLPKLTNKSVDADEEPGTMRSLPNKTFKRVRAR